MAAINAMIFILSGLATASVPLPESLSEFLLTPSQYRDPTRLVVKLSETHKLHWDRGLQGTDNVILLALLKDAKPFFSRSPNSLLKEHGTYDVSGTLPRLTRYLQIRHSNAAALAVELLAHPEISDAYLASLPIPPPADVPPETPLFEQVYRQEFPQGLSINVQDNWPNAYGEGIVIADIEYGWSTTHEDLSNAPSDVSWGWNSNDYIYHGNGVLGLLIADRNDYGITGISPESEALVISPFTNQENYNVADAISGATDILSAGDVLLIEQQGYVDNQFCPVEVEPAVFDAISIAVAKGIIVVEPTGNGALNLDASEWGGWFDRDIQDSGAIMVGGGASTLGDGTPRMWYPGGSAYGSRVDVQAWFDNTVTLGGPGLVDLFFPAGDVNQAYTAEFGGSSGASAMVAGLCAVVNGDSVNRWGSPISPELLRSNLNLSGYGPSVSTPFPIGTQPDLRQFLWRYSLR